MYVTYLINICSVGIADSLRHKLTLIQISRSSFSSPADVTLKLSNGSIDAHRMILAAVSPVFERMFYGDFKEGKSVIVNLPKDDSKIMNLLIDFVYRGSCELNLDDIFPVFEAFNRYQINKVPFCHMCSDVILAQMESTNYITLLEKFAKVMSEEGIKKAAYKVMCYTNRDFITRFDTTKDLPEEVLLQLLPMDITNHEIDVFDFLVKWHDYQTKDLGMSLQLTQQIFNCVRYSLIIPQVLSSRVVMRSDLVSSQQLGDAYHYIYNSCKPLGEYDSKDCTLEPPVSTLRKPGCSLKMEWIPYNSSYITMKHDKLDECNVDFTGSLPVNGHIVKSLPLKNGIYTFSILNVAASFSVYDSFTDRNRITSSSDAPISVSIITNQSDVCVYSYALIGNSVITVYVHGEYLFLKIIKGDKVKSTTSITLETDLFSICICNLLQLNSTNKCSFCIRNHIQ